MLFLAVNLRSFQVSIPCIILCPRLCIFVGNRTVWGLDNAWRKRIWEKHQFSLSVCHSLVCHHFCGDVLVYLLCNWFAGKSVFPHQVFPALLVVMAESLVYICLYVVWSNACQDMAHCSCTGLLLSLCPAVIAGQARCQWSQEAVWEGEVVELRVTC